MTSTDAKNGIGRAVVEDKICEVGTLMELIYVQGGDGRRSEYLVRVGYPTQERTVPLSAVKFTKTQSRAVPLVRKGTDHNKFLDSMHSVFYSGPKEQGGTPKQYDDRHDAYASVFCVVFGRKPTAAELEYMAGFTEYPTCQRCGTRQRQRFLPDGSYGLECSCTDSLNRAFSKPTEDGSR